MSSHLKHCLDFSNLLDHDIYIPLGLNSFVSLFPFNHPTVVSLVSHFPLSSLSPQLQDLHLFHQACDWIFLLLLSLLLSARVTDKLGGTWSSWGLRGVGKLWDLFWYDPCVASGWYQGGKLVSQPSATNSFNLLSSRPSHTSHADSRFSACTSPHSYFMQLARSPSCLSLFCQAKSLWNYSTLLPKYSSSFILPYFQDHMVVMESVIKSQLIYSDCLPPWHNPGVL